MTIRAGKFRHVLVIQVSAPIIDAYGDRVTTWADFRTVRGSLQPLSGREYFVSQQYESEVKSKAQIRYIPGITTAMRLKHEDLFYNIVFVQNFDMKNRELCLMLSEGLRD